MRALVLATVVMIAATPAFAAESWDASMMEDEGGPRMMAWVQGKGGDVPPDLYLSCSGATELNLRYSMGSGPGEGVEMPPGPLDFVFSFGGSTATMEMRFEEYDGAYAGYFPNADPLIGLMRTSANMAISDPTGVWHEQVFSLEGSGKAIDAVLKSCN